MSADELLVTLFDGKPHALAAPMGEWLASSRRFATFVSENQTKIRKKLRSTEEREAARDLALELETAYLLLRERSLSLVYEPPPRASTRHPDFAVSFTTSLTFMLEVTRLRSDESGRSFEERLIDAVCGKLGQLAPGSGNVLLVGVDGRSVDVSELRAILLRLQQRAERSEAWLMQRYGFRERAEFFQHYYRLSALFVRPIPLKPGAAASMWENPQGRHLLTPKARTALARSHTP